MLVVSVVTVGAGRYAGQADDLSPAESRANRIVFLEHRMKILFSVQPAVFADRVLPHQLQHGLDGMPLLAIELDSGRRAALIVAADGIFGCGQ